VEQRRTNHSSQVMPLYGSQLRKSYYRSYTDVQLGYTGVQLGDALRCINMLYTMYKTMLWADKKTNIES